MKIPPDSVRSLDGLINRLKDHKDGVKWVRAASIHITLKFLGNIMPERVEEIAVALAGPLAEKEPFEVTIKGVGGFPNLRRPRVLWTGIDDPVVSLKELAEIVDEKLSEVGFSREKRPLTPHLTLGRVKNFKSIESVVEHMRSEMDFEGGAIPVDSVCLFQSELKPTGAVYTILKEFELKGKE